MQYMVRIIYSFKYEKIRKGYMMRSFKKEDKNIRDFLGRQEYRIVKDFRRKCSYFNRRNLLEVIILYLFEGWGNIYDVVEMEKYFGIDYY